MRIKLFENFEENLRFKYHEDKLRTDIDGILVDNGDELVIETFLLCKKSVIQYDLNLNELNQYDSITDAYKKTNVKAGSIVRCCKGRGITAGGFIWKYKTN